MLGTQYKIGWVHSMQNDSVNTVVEGLNGKNGMVILLTIVIMGFGFLIYNFSNKAFDFIETQISSMITQMEKTEESIVKLSSVIIELNTKFDDKAKR